MPRFINMESGVPGHEALEVIARLGRHVPHCPGYAPVVVDHAQGALLTDVDGNTLIDMAGTPLGGHTAPRVASALHEQVDRLIHACPATSVSGYHADLAELLAELAPIHGPAASVFCASGQEALSLASALAREHTGREAVIGSRGAPGADSERRSHSPYCYRCPLGANPSACDADCVESLLVADGQDEAGAVIVDLVQIDAGLIVPPPAFLARVDELSRGRGLVLVADESEIPFGLSGDLFASRVLGVSADVICFSQSMAAGVPFGGMIGRTDVVLHTGDLFRAPRAGNPLGVAAALEVILSAQGEDLPRRAGVLGERVLAGFSGLMDECTLVGDVRRVGAIAAMELVTDRSNREPAAKETALAVAKCIKRGVIPLRVGAENNVLCVSVSPSMTDDQLDEALSVVEQAVREVDRGR